MKRRASILLLTTSPIIEAGLTSLLASLPEWDLSIHSTDPLSVANDASRIRPTILVADPLALSSDEIKLVRDAIGGHIRLIAIYHSALPQDVIATYDEAISIYANSQSVSSVIAKAIGEARHAEGSYDSDSGRPELSPREKDVVIGVVKGLSNKEIASSMNVSVNTVTTHRRNIASKLKIHSPAGLTIYAIMSKLVSLEDVKL
ncbi:MAG: LuxR C-terminal-related transcriptional regulator [Pseudoflavonifractor sp.]|nr:LuxR C-terminal-related transcriptional regulator [Alloprevotella sp.]MCM1117062.1 LuxR C-terminal-related transcriptional regulator [Pseudoflavonifractor sp.]